MASILTMSTYVNICQPHHQVLVLVVGKCRCSGTRDFRLEKILGRETVFSHVSVVSGLVGQKLSTKIGQDWSKSSICT